MTVEDHNRCPFRKEEMKLLTILAVLLASATPASAKCCETFVCGDVAEVDIQTNKSTQPRSTDVEIKINTISDRGGRRGVGGIFNWKLIKDKYGTDKYVASFTGADGKTVKCHPWEPKSDEDQIEGNAFRKRLYPTMEKWCARYSDWCATRSMTNGKK
jgi:hypothetical protein